MTGFSPGLSTDFTMLVLAIVLGSVHTPAVTLAITNERGLWCNVGARNNAPPLRSALAG